MKNEEDAVKLSKTIGAIGKLANKQTVCVITNMDEPLGCAVGNTLEVIEAVDFLKGNFQNDVKEVVLNLGAYMVKLAGKGDDLEENKKRIMENVLNGKAYKKLLELIQIQGGDISYIEDTSKLEKAKYIIPVVSNKNGYIKSIDALEVGKISANLGAGRIKKEDSIDNSVGIVLLKKTADIVKAGDILAYIHSNDEQNGKEQVKKLHSIYEIVDKIVEKPKHIIDIIQ